MRAIQSFLAAALALAAATVSAQTRPPAAQARPPSPPASPPSARAADWVYLPGPPEVVAGATVTSAAWSPDGQYAVAVRQMATMRSLEDVQREPSIVLWSASRRSSTVVWRVASSDYTVYSVKWMPGTGVALATVAIDGPQDSRLSFWRIDARRATAAEVAGIGPTEGLSISPGKPYAVVTGVDEAGVYLRTMGAGGQMGLPVRPPDPAARPYGWTPDGASLYLTSAPEGAEDTPEGIEGLTFHLFHPATGKFSPGPAKPQFAQFAEHAEPKWPFRVVMAETSLAGAPAKDAPALPSARAGDAKARSLWLVQGEGPAEERLLVAADAQVWSISPRGDAILYTCREGCFVVPLVRIDGAVMEKAREAARRTMLMSNGKQVALAALMYAMDNDDNLPPQGTDLRTLLQPYTKSQEVFNGLTGPGDGFVYTFGGGPMGSVEDPANTRMGFIPAPGGQVIVYMDGHVTFEPAGTGTTPP